MPHFSATYKQIAHAAFSRRLSERLWLFTLVFLAQLRVLFTYQPYQVEIPAEEVQPLLLEQLLRIGGWASLLTLLFALSRRKWLTRTLGLLFSVVVLMFTAYELYLLALYHVTYTIGYPPLLEHGSSDYSQNSLPLHWLLGVVFCLRCSLYLVL